MFFIWKPEQKNTILEYTNSNLETTVRSVKSHTKETDTLGQYPWNFIYTLTQEYYRSETSMKLEFETNHDVLQPTCQSLHISLTSLHYCISGDKFTYLLQNRNQTPSMLSDKLRCFLFWLTVMKLVLCDNNECVSLGMKFNTGNRETERRDRAWARRVERHTRERKCRSRENEINFSLLLTDCEVVRSVRSATCSSMDWSHKHCRVRHGGIASDRPARNEDVHLGCPTWAEQLVPTITHRTIGSH